MTNHNAALAEITKVASYLAHGARLPSYDKDDHKRPVPAWLLKEIEEAVDDLRVQAAALKRACDSLRPSLTTPPAPVLPEDLREAVKWCNFFLHEQNTVEVDERARAAVETLIRAATQPQPTDAQKRAYELLDRIDVQCRAVGHPVGGIDELKAIITVLQSGAAL